MSAEPVPIRDPRDEGRLAMRLHKLEQELGQVQRVAAMRDHTVRSLLELIENLNEPPDLFRMVDLVLYNLMGHFGTAQAALWMYPEQDGPPPALIRAHGLSRQTARALGMACAEAVVDHDGSTSPGGDADPRHWGEAVAVLAEGSGIRALARIPGRGRTLGLVALGPRIGGAAYGEAELHTLHAALLVLGTATQNLGLVGRMTENNRQLRRANDELKEVDRLKSEFLSNVNHELRTPLSIMMGYLDSMLGQQMSREHEQRMLKIVREGAVKLQKHLETLLTFSDATRGELRLNIELGDLGELLERYGQERLPGANLVLREFAWDIQADLPPVRFDPMRLVQVVDALVDNALKFTQEGGRVELSVAGTGEGAHREVTIAVQDNGPGIPAHRVPILFEPFRQIDGSSTRTVGGMGLGLSFCREVMTAMGGRIAVASEPGKGSTFTLRLPAS